MNAHADKKALMKRSLANPGHAVNRFAMAEARMQAYPRGLLGGAATAEEIDAAEQRASDVRVIPLDLLHENPRNARHIYDPDAVRTLALSLANLGQLIPALAAPHPDLEGHYVLIDGHYRSKALRAIGRTEMTCSVRAVENDFEMYRLSYRINDERNPQSALDNALAWQGLLADKTVATMDEIADAIGISKGMAAKTMALLKLPEQVIARLRVAPAKFGVALGYEVYQCSTHMPEAELLNLVDRVIQEDLSVKQVAAIRSKLELGGERKVKEVGRQYRILADGQQIGFIKVWDAARKVALEVHLADAKARRDLLAYLQQRFGIEEDATLAVAEAPAVEAPTAPEASAG